MGNITGTNGSLFSYGRARSDAVDAIDYFRFTLTERKRISLGLRRLDADATLVLEDERGTVIRSESKGDASFFSFSTNLEPGTYYVRVMAPDQTERNYKLFYRIFLPQ